MQLWNPKRERDGPVTSLVFPTYNPGPLIEQTWQHVDRFLHDAPGNWEVLFVCDGCTDGTPARLHALIGANQEDYKVLSYTPNRGKGYAVRYGLEAATGAWRLFTDVDLAYSLEEVLRVAEQLWAGADVAIASRTHPQSRLLVAPALQGYVYRRHLQSVAFSFLVRLLLPLTVRDTQAGLKGISARVARLILPQLRCDGFGFDCELLTACTCHELSLTEVPVRVRYEDVTSTTGVWEAGRMLWELWGIRRTWRHVTLPSPGLTLGPCQREAA